jgi:hypothetical protein
MKKIVTWTLCIASTLVAVGLGIALAILLFIFAGQAWLFLMSDSRYNAERFDMLAKQMPAAGLLFIGVTAVAYVQWKRNLSRRASPWLSTWYYEGVIHQTNDNEPSYQRPGSATVTTPPSSNARTPASAMAVATRPSQAPAPTCRPVPIESTQAWTWRR